METLKHHEVFILEITIKEINLISNKSLRSNLSRLIKPFKVLKVTEEIKSLAFIYLNARVIPKGYLNDALLIVTTTAYNLEILVSWNFKHLVNRRVKTKINALNILYNFPSVDIAAPAELL